MELLCDSHRGQFIPQIMARLLFDAGWTGIAWSDGKVRRVYCDVYSNAGSCYCMINGCKVSVEGFNLISEAAK